jgi:hypothetical protein
MFGHHRHTAAAILGLTVLAGCTYHPSRFPIIGKIDDKSRLTGQWLGEFTSTHPDRSRSIAFQLEPGRDSASGEVSLDASYVGQGVRHQGQGLHPRVSTTTVVRIRYVRADESTVEGALEPYDDPDCGCMVTTAFLGVLRGDSITGEYVSRSRWATRQGAWRMSRRMAASVNQPTGSQAIGPARASAARSAARGR